MPVNYMETTTEADTDTLRAVKTFGQRLRSAREARGYSQEQLGAEVGVTKATVSKWELDKGVPSLAGLRGLRATLGFSLDYAICGDASPATLAANVYRVMDQGPSTDEYEVNRARDSVELGLLIRFRALKPRARAGLLELLKPGE